MAKDPLAWEINELEFPKDKTPEDKIRFLLKYAILAPSPENTQPWKFKVDGNKAEFSIDPAKSLPVADPEKRELHVSLGCAVANFLVAADKFDAVCAIDFPAEGPAAVVITLDFGETAPKRAFADEIFSAIPKRATNRAKFREEPLDEASLTRLEGAVVGGEGILLSVVTGPEHKMNISSLVKKADEVLGKRKDYREECGKWMKSDWDKSGEGLPGYSVGAGGLVSLVAPVFAKMLDTGKADGKDDFDTILAAPLICVVSSETEDRPSWLRGGVAVELLWLTAVSIGCDCQPMSAALENSETRLELRSVIGQNGFPQFILRVGKSERTAKHTPRRELEGFIEKIEKPQAAPAPQ
jgi:hypothetical protein